MSSNPRSTIKFVVRPVDTYLRRNSLLRARNPSLQQSDNRSLPN